ncbi:MAG TPA: YcnI family protein [Jatrophihabitans sp.]|nr:YcnI family protein [Jatrophihabitans sp.]
MRIGKRMGRAGVVLAAAAVGLVAGAGPAWAHVTVTAPGVAAGASDATITFRVPDESDSASTTGLKLQLPTDHPLAGVLVAPMTGWTATIKQAKLATPIKTDDGDITQVVSEIDWTAAAGAGIKPGYFGQFTIIAGQLPDGVDALTFKAVQQYSDGSTVSWIEESAPGSTTEPDHPAPVLKLAADSAAGPSGQVTATAAPAAGGSSTDGASKGAATTGIVLGAIGAVLGVVALGLVLLRGRGARSA